MNFTELKKLDEDTLKALTDAAGPADECICNILAPPDKPRGLRGSIKKAFSSLKMKKNRTGINGGGRGRDGRRSIEVPITFLKPGSVTATKEEVKRSKPCGKCGCDNEKLVLRHMTANLRITAPDVSTICPCPSNCLPGSAKLNDNIRVSIE